MKIEKQEERVIKKKEEKEIPVENYAAIPFVGKRNADGKKSGKVTETGKAENVMGGWEKKGNLWKTAGYVQRVTQIAQQFSGTEEESQNPYMDEKVIQMLAYVSASEKNSKQEVSVSESDTEKTEERSAAAKREQTKDGPGSGKIAYSQEERDTPTNPKQELPRSKTDEYAAETIDQTAYRMNWWVNRNTKNTKSAAKEGKISERSEEKTSGQFPGRNASEKRTASKPSQDAGEFFSISNFQENRTKTDRFQGSSLSGEKELSQHREKSFDGNASFSSHVQPSKAAKAYEEQEKRNTGSQIIDYREIQGKNAGKKTAKSISDRRTDQIQRLTQKTMDATQAAGKVVEKGQGNHTGKTTILSFAEAAWKAGQKIKNEGFGRQNQERNFRGNDREIRAYAQNETVETSKRITNFLITFLFGIPLLPILTLVIVICTLLFGSGSASQGTGLSAQYDQACYLAAKYESGGNPDQTGGDGGNACGEFQFDNRYELGPFVSWCYEKDPTFYAAFQPFLGMTTELKSNEDFYNAWHTICDVDIEVFEAAQCEDVYTQTLVPLLQEMTAYYSYDFVNCSDALKGCILSFGNRDGKYVASLRRYFDGTTASSTDREIIERAYNAMIERRPHIQRWRYEKMDCLALLDGVLDVYEPSSNAAGSIDWSWKRIAGGSEVGNLVAQIAVSKVGCGYSQAMRDEEGWYDCSSLVYRCYAEAGITYLNGKTAADEAKYLVEHGMTVSASELQPGDIIFYSYESNGRYRNISHVAIYIGNNEMVHAANPSRGVVRDPFRPSNLTEPLYARPQ